MRNNSDHAMFPEATHDEQSAQSFVKTLRVFTTNNFHAGNTAILADNPLSRRPDGSCPSRKELREASGSRAPEQVVELHDADHAGSAL